MSKHAVLPKFSWFVFYLKSPVRPCHFNSGWINSCIYLIFVFFLNFLSGHNFFYTPVFDFWWRLLWFSFVKISTYWGFKGCVPISKLTKFTLLIINFKGMFWFVTNTNLHSGVYQVTLMCLQVTLGCLPTYTGVPHNLHWDASRLTLEASQVMLGCAYTSIKFSEFSKFSMSIRFVMVCNSSHVEFCFASVIKIPKNFKWKTGF